MPLLVCIVGPTAIGKTRMGIQLAQAFQTEILSADSRQFFKEMTLGTAVPSEEELTAVKHHFIQNKSILESYSVGDFERDALALLKKLFQKHDIVVMVGGSGLYVDAVVKGLDEFPEVASEVREQLNETLKKEGLAPLQKELSEVDPKYFHHGAGKPAPFFYVTVNSSLLRLTEYSSKRLTGRFLFYAGEFYFCRSGFVRRAIYIHLGFHN